MSYKDVLDEHIEDTFLRQRLKKGMELLLQQQHLIDEIEKDTGGSTRLNCKIAAQGEDYVILKYDGMFLGESLHPYKGFVKVTTADGEMFWRDLKVFHPTLEQCWLDTLVKSENHANCIQEYISNAFLKMKEV